MDVTYPRLFLALTAIRFRALGDPKGMPEAIITLCTDALEGLSIDKVPTRRGAVHFDTLRIDGEPVFEVEIRSIINGPEGERLRKTLRGAKEDTAKADELAGKRENGDSPPREENKP